jgi:dihydropteroate synthase
MINELLGTTAAEALNGTTVLNTLALLQGAAILRVHDVREARQAVQLVEALDKARSSEVHHTTTRTW